MVKKFNFKNSSIEAFLNKKGVIPVFIVILMILTLLISIGYAALNQNLNVSGEAFLRAHGNVRITGLKSSSSASEGFETYTPEYSKKGTKTFTTLPNSSSSVTYTVQMNNTTGVKYKFDSVTVSNTNSNVQCIPSVAENSIIEPGASSFTIQVKYKSGVTITDKTDVCEIKYEFSIYDMTPPTLSVTLVSSTETTRTVKIIAQDEADGSGLSEDNDYKYYFSTSKTELADGEWKTYKSGEEIVLEGLNQAKYLWVYPIKDRAGNINDNKTSTSNPYWISWYNFVSTYTVSYNGNRFSTIPKTENGITVTYDKDTSILTLNGTQTTQNVNFMLASQSFTDGEQYRTTLEYISGNVTNPGSCAFVTEPAISTGAAVSTRNYADTGLPTSGSKSSILTITSVGASEGTRLFNWLYIGTESGTTFTDYKVKVNVTKVDTKRVKYNQTYGTLGATPTRKGYNFAGWYTDEIGGTEVTSDTVMTTGSDHNIYAHWTPITYTLTVNPNGGTLNGSTANKTYSMQYGETRGIANPTRDGYIFGGWTVSGTESSMNGTVFQMGTANATITAKWKSLKPSYTYTGKSQLIDDGNGNWRIKFITSGTLTFNDLGNGSSGVDIFLVGGGGGGGSTRTQTIRGSFGKHSNSWGTYDGAYINRNDGGGGGGGYTKTMTNISMAASTSYNIVIGAGGAAGSGDNASGSAGGTTQISNITDASVSGGSGGTYEAGGNGGSGGGASAYHKQWTVIPCTANKRACLSVSDEYTNATAGASNGGSSSGTGQGRTTREFGSSTGTLYAGGGGGGAENNTSGSNAAGGSGGGGAGHTAGAANTGGGGGGGSAGGSGIVIIRNHASSGTTGGVSYTYTGDSEFISDGGDNWKIKFLTSGTLTFSSLGTASSGIDLFLVGGGSAEGGGGYTATHKGLSIAKGTSYSIVVGSGGTSSSVNGGTSSGFGKSVNGGQGKDGGSGAGGSGYVNDGATGGSNGGNGGLGGDNWTGGTGQGTTTREFGESSGALYAGGGGGGLGSGCKACLPDSNGKMTVDKTSVGGAGGDSTAGNGEGYKGAASCTNGKTNTGGGAGLGKRGTAQCTGGSGVVIIRNKR